VEDILHERGADICHETVWFWVEHLGLKFSQEIRKNRAGQHSNWQWHLDEVFVKINGEHFYLWRAVGHEGQVLECYVAKRCNKAAVKKFLIKIM
jgi:putative transposase